MKDKVLKQNDVDEIIKQIEGHFESEFEKSKSYKPSLKNTMNPKYKGARAFTHKWNGIVLS